MAEDCGSSSAPCSPKEQLALALGTTKAMAEYARAEHLTQADERFCQLSRQRCRRVPPEAVCLPCFKDGERGCRTTEMKHAAAVGGNVLVVADARAEVIAEFVVAATEALR